MIFRVFLSADQLTRLTASSIAWFTLSGTSRVGSTGGAARLYPISSNITTADSHTGTFSAACAVTTARTRRAIRLGSGAISAMAATGGTRVARTAGLPRTNELSSARAGARAWRGGRAAVVPGVSPGEAGPPLGSVR